MERFNAQPDTRPTSKLFSKFKKLNDGYQEVIIKFFISFARLEFVLKYNNWVKSDGQVDWRQFYRNKGKVYKTWRMKTSDDRVLRAIEYLKLEPPQTLEKRNEDLKFVPLKVGNRTNLSLLSLYIKTVRNNLFHGNKEIGADNGRDQKLLECSLVVIDDIIMFLGKEDDFVEESIS